MITIMVTVKKETVQYLHAFLDRHPEMTFAQLAGQMLDAQIAYRLEVERMSDNLPTFFKTVGEDWP